MKIKCDSELLRAGFSFSNENLDYVLLLDYLEEKGFPITDHWPVSSQYRDGVLNLGFDEFNISLSIQPGGFCDINIDSKEANSIHYVQNYSSKLSLTLDSGFNFQDLNLLRGSEYIEDLVLDLTTDVSDIVFDVVGSLSNLCSLKIIGTSSLGSYELMKLGSKPFLKYLFLTVPIDDYDFLRILEIPNLKIFNFRSLDLTQASVEPLLRHPSLSRCFAIDYGFRNVSGNSFWNLLRSLGVQVSNTGIFNLR